MAGNQSLSGFDGAFVNAGHIGDEAASILRARTRPAGLVGLAKQADDLGAQFTSGHHIDGAVDRFMADAQGLLHTRECAPTCSGDNPRPSPSMTWCHTRLPYHELSLDAWLGCQRTGSGLGCLEAIAACQRRATRPAGMGRRLPTIAIEFTLTVHHRQKLFIPVEGLDVQAMTASAPRSGRP